MKPSTYSAAMVLAGMVLTHAARAATPAQTPLAYIHASSQLDAQANPTQYHPLNLLDHNPNTVWCEGKNGGQSGESVDFVFKTAQVVDRVVIAATAQSGRRVDSVRLTDGQSVVRIAITPDVTDTHMTNALRGTTVTLTIDHVGVQQSSSTLGADVVCLAEVKLYHGEELLTPNEHATDTPSGAIVGSWNAEPLGAPERSLVFAMDGTWTWTHRPLLGGVVKEVSGTYRFRGAHLLMRKGKEGAWTDVGLRQKRVTVDPQDLGAPLGDYDAMHLNDNLGKEFAGDYNNAQF